MDNLPIQSVNQLMDSWEPIFHFTAKETKFLEQEIRREATEQRPPPAPKKQRLAPKITINLKDFQAHKRNRLKFELSTQFNIPANLLTDKVDVLENPEYRVLLERRQQQFAYLHTKSVHPPLNVSTAELARLFVRERLRSAGYEIADDITREEAKGFLLAATQPACNTVQPTALAKSFD